MIHTFASKLFNWRQALPIVLGLGAAAGWSMFVASGHSSAETERQLREQIVSLQAGISERSVPDCAVTGYVARTCAFKQPNRTPPTPC